MNSEKEENHQHGDKPRESFCSFSPLHSVLKVDGKIVQSGNIFVA